jgi:uncharacterized protein
MQKSLNFRENKSPRAYARGIFCFSGGVKSAEAEDITSHSSLGLPASPAGGRPRSSAKADKIFLWIFLLLAVAIGSYFFLQDSNSTDGDSKIISINNKKFKIESARSPEEQQKGLGGRESLCADCGMFFEFTQEGKHSFWMRDMKFPLDIIWISGNKVVFVVKNISPDNQNVFTPPVEANRVLEINAGLSDKHEIREGSKVE